MNFSHISFEVKNKVAYVGFGVHEKKSMTTLGVEALSELNTLVDALGAGRGEQADCDFKDIQGLIFFSHKPGCFLAGADINLIASLKTESEGASGAEKGQELFNKIEDLRIPTVACVNGVCLGGGLELALSCRHLIASNSKKTVLGLPEVRLGLIPGFGGTYRLPLRVSLSEALGLILTGKHVQAKKAYKIGLVDEIYPEEKLLTMALTFLNKPKFFNRKSSLKESIEHLAQDNFITRKIIFQKARENVLKETKGFYQAPLKILEVMENGQGKGRSTYLSIEAQAFGELCVSDQSKNLQHIFFMNEDSKKYRGPATTGKIPGIGRSAVLGAGTMGGGIAWLLSDNGFRPLMKDISQDALELGLKQASKNFQKALQRKHMTRDDFERKMRSIIPRTDYKGFQKVDLVIEAIVEDLDIKRKVFAEMEKKVRTDCLLASNTSSLSVTKMSEALEHPERFAGLHFFNPVHRMPLVEIITHDKVSPETVAALYNWVLKVKKTPVIVKDGPGFLVNRILMPFINESVYLLEEGVSIDDLDNACCNFGMPMGPCRLMDEVGLDVLVKVGKIMVSSLGERAKPASISAKVVEEKFLGKKNGKGFYLYDQDGKVIGKNPDVVKFLPSASERSMDETLIQMRVFLPMINEAATILDEGIVSSPADVDLALIFGIGFPPFRGGLLRYADHEGLDRILTAIQKFADSVSAERYRPSSLLKKLVAEKKKFYDLHTSESSSVH